jgi:hypothetical protein
LLAQPSPRPFVDTDITQRGLPRFGLTAGDVEVVACLDGVDEVDAGEIDPDAGGFERGSLEMSECLANSM